MHLGMSGRMTIHGAKAKVKPGAFHYKAAGRRQRRRQARSRRVRDRGRHAHRLHRSSPLRTDGACGDGATRQRQAVRGLGPEPLDDAFTPAVLSASAERQAHADQGGAARSARRRGPRQHLCLRGAVPRAAFRPSDWRTRLRASAREKLVPAIKTVLRAAIEAGGSSLRDYARADGELGYFQHHFAVYDREGEPCPGRGCKGKIKRIVQSGPLDVLLSVLPALGAGVDESCALHCPRCLRMAHIAAQHGGWAPMAYRTSWCGPRARSASSRSTGRRR